MSEQSRFLSVLDSTFLRIETIETPMHIGMLMEFTIPESAGPGFLRDLVGELREPRPLRPPFNQVLRSSLVSRLAPASRTIEALDMEYHVRHTALPAPGGERALGELVSHLHGTVLDRTRPLWTCHVIEGLDEHRFALYVKIHHSLTDGINGLRLATGQLATTPEGAWLPPWQQAPQSQNEERPPRKKGTPFAPLQAAGSFVRGLTALQRTDADAEPVRVPFEAPPSMLNAPVTNARRVATQQFDMERLRAVGSRHGHSLNDVFLAVCGEALRRYLLDHDMLPNRSLVAGVPVSLREEGQEGGNAVGFVWAALGTDVTDPVERLETVHRSMTAAKDHLRAMAPSARPAFTLMTMALPTAVLLSGQASRLPLPSMNVTISNVPGPHEARYLGGARLDACYPMSLLFQGLGLNITCISYDGRLNVGVVGGRDALPSLQKIAVYLNEALDDLEGAIGTTPAT